MRINIIWSVPQHSGDFFYRDPVAPRWRSYDPNSDCIISNVIYSPSSIEEAEDPSQWYPVNYRIEYSDSSSGELTGVLEKLPTDSFPLYTSYKDAGSAKKSINNEELEYIEIFSFSLTVYPNPANEKINITSDIDVETFVNFTGVTTYEYIKIYNLEGKIVYEDYNIPMKDSYVIDTKEFKVGNYYIEAAIFCNGRIKGHGNFIISR